MVVLERSPEAEILWLVFDFPTKGLHFREVERRTSLSIGTVSKYAKKLAEKGLVELEEIANTTVIKANTDSEDYKKMKRTHNLARIGETGLTEYLKKELRPDALVLFGSYAEGTDVESSDVDIAVLGGRDKTPNLDEFEEKLNRGINLTRAEESEKEFLNTLANGIVLDGYLEVA